jgi:hypothetical protein
MAHGSHLGGSTGIPPDLLQQIIDAGLSDDRMGMAGQKARLGASLFGTPGAQGMNVGGTYKAASPFEHLSTAMSRILGGKMQRDAHGEMEGLLGQKAAGRRAMGQQVAGLAIPPTAEALNAPAPPAFQPPNFVAPDLGAFMDGVNETPARALARAMDERSRLGSTAALSGDPAIAASGQGLLADARTLGAQQFEGQQNKMKLLESRQTRDAEASFRDRQQTEVERSNLAREKILSTPKPAGMGGMGGHGAFLPPDDTEAIADAIARGDLPPNLAPYRSNASAVAASLARKGINVSEQQMNFSAEQKAVSSLNSTQQVRLRQTMGTLDHSLNKLEEVYGRWQKLGPASGFRKFNKAALAAAQQVGGETGATAQELTTLINDLTAEVANVYMGGNSPTDHALKLAGENLKADWNEETFKQLLGLMRTQMKFRRQAMDEVGAAGTRGENQYARTPAAEPAAAQVKSGSPAASAEDQAAKQWVDANPNDPRAAQILERLKTKGL